MGKNRTYYEEQWISVDTAESTKEMLEIIDGIDFSKNIEGEEDGLHVRNLLVRKDLIKTGVMKNKSEMDKLKAEGKREYSEEDKAEIKIKLQYAYGFIIEGLKKYLDLNEENYNIIALWIIGTYSHKEFPSYPYLFLNAMRGSGKTRTMKLITFLANNGAMLNSLTEAVLFRENGTLCIDEFEGLGRKGTEALKELLNSAYKRGTKVKRMRKEKKFDGERQVVEEFDVYRPIVMANIYGLVDEALKDRCITLILEKSNDYSKTNLVELFEFEESIINAKNLLKSCRLCHVVTLLGVYRTWNDYVIEHHNDTHDTHNTNDTNTTNNTLFKKIKDSNLNGREIELCLPLFIVAEQLGVVDKTINTLKNVFAEKKDEELNENLDISLYDFFSQEKESESWVSQKEILVKFKEFLGRNDEWINDRWLGRRLTTLKLYKEKKRMAHGRYIVPNYKKAQEKIKMFK